MDEKDLRRAAAALLMPGDKVTVDGRPAEIVEPGPLIVKVRYRDGKEDWVHGWEVEGGAAASEK